MFEYNPFAQSLASEVAAAPPGCLATQLPEWARMNYELTRLMESYQIQLAALSAEHAGLASDFAALNLLVAQSLGPDSKQLATQPPEEVLLLKRGLDLRLIEFDEGCRRIRRLEVEIQRRLDDVAFDIKLGDDAAQTDAELRRGDEALKLQLRQQQKLLHLQFHELDEVKFQRDIHEEEARRLRQVLKNEDINLIAPGTAGTLHSAPMNITDNVLLRSLYSANPSMARHASLIKFPAQTTPAVLHGTTTQQGAQQVTQQGGQQPTQQTQVNQALSTPTSPRPTFWSSMFAPASPRTTNLSQPAPPSQPPPPRPAARPAAPPVPHHASTTLASDYQTAAAPPPAGPAGPRPPATSQAVYGTASGRLSGRTMASPRQSIAKEQSWAQRQGSAGGRSDSSAFLGTSSSSEALHVPARRSGAKTTLELPPPGGPGGPGGR